MPQQGADLVGAGYATSRPLASLLGGTTNVSQANVPARTNLDYMLGNLVDGTAPGTGVAISMPVPVLPGDVVTNITVLVGATAASVPTHSYAALYQGTGSAPALIAQTTDGGSAAIAASAAFSFKFSTPQTISVSNSPFGFVYVSIGLTATTVPTLASMTSTTAVLYQWYTNGPLFVAATHGTAVGGTAPATIASTTNVAKAPIVVVT